MIGILISVAAGYALLRRSGRAVSISLSIALGLALLIWFSIVLGTFSLSTFASLPILVLAVMGYYLYPSTMGNSSFSVPRNRLDKAAFYVSFVLISAGVLVGLRSIGTPILSYDLLSYHLPIAQEFRSSSGASRLINEPFTFYEHLPLGGHILQSYFLLDGVHGIGPQLLIFVTVLAGAACAARIAGHLGARKGVRGLVAATYLLNPIMISCITGGLTDPILALFLLAGVSLLLGSRGDARYLFLSGFVVGSAYAIKANAISVVLIPFASLCFAFTFRRSVYTADLLKVWLLIAGGTLLALLPWLMRSWFLGGHPLFPFRGESEVWSNAQGQFVVDVHNPISLGGSTWWHDLIFKNVAFGYTMAVVPVSALLIVAFATIFRRPTVVALFLIPGLLGYGLWLLVADSPIRFLLACVALILPVTIAILFRGFRRPVYTIISWVVLLIILTPSVPIIRQAFAVPVIYNASVREELRDLLGERFLQIVRSADNYTADGRLLLLFEARPALFSSPTISNTVWDKVPWAEMLKESSTADEFENKLVEAGITGIFVNEIEWGRLLAFYAKDRLNSAFDPRTTAGLNSGNPVAAIESYFEQFPPFRFSEFTKADMLRLEEFLLRKRTQTFFVYTHPTRQEIWFARLAPRENPND